MSDTRECGQTKRCPKCGANAIAIACYAIRGENVCHMGIRVYGTANYQERGDDAKHEAANIFARFSGNASDLEPTCAAIDFAFSSRGICILQPCFILIDCPRLGQ